MARLGFGRSAMVIGVLVALMSTACGDDGGPGTLTGEPGDPNNVSRTVDIEATNDLRFIPDTVEVEAGETIEFRITNVADVDHEFVLGPPHVHTGMDHSMAQPEMTGTLSPGKSKSIVWAFTEPGEVTFACYIAGHDEAGMTGTVKVS